MMAAATGTPRPLIVGVCKSDDLATGSEPAALLLKLKAEGVADAAVIAPPSGSHIVLMPRDIENTRKFLAHDSSISQIIEGDNALFHVFSLLSGGDAAEALIAAESDAREAGTLGPDIALLLNTLRDGAMRFVSGSPQDMTSSFAAAVASLAENIHGALGNCRVLLLGDGAFGEQILQHLLANGVRDAMVLTRQPEPARALAERMGIHFDDFAALPVALADADIVVSAIGDGRLSLTEPDMAEALRARRHRPVLIVDGGIPGDVAPAIDRLDDAFLFTLDDIDRLAMETLAAAPAETVDSETVIEETLAAYRLAVQDPATAEIETRLRASLEALRRSAVTRHPDDADQATRTFTQMILNRIKTGMGANETGPGGSGNDLNRLADMFEGESVEKKKGDKT